MSVCNRDGWREPGVSLTRAVPTGHSQYLGTMYSAPGGV